MSAKKKRDEIPPIYIPIPLLLLLTLVALILMGIFLFNLTSRLKVSQVRKQQVQSQYQNPPPAFYPNYTSPSLPPYRP